MKTAAMTYYFLTVILPFQHGGDEVRSRAFESKTECHSVRSKWLKVKGARVFFNCERMDAGKKGKYWLQ